MPGWEPNQHLLREWLSYRRYAVPVGTVERATGRRLAGDWRGACAAAGVGLTDEVGERLPAAAQDDLRHFVPDLLRWHLPQQGYPAWDWYDGVVPLARYPNGSALMVRLVYAHPPQRRVMVWFARSVPRVMIELPRPLWHDGHTADLAEGAGGPLLGVEAAAAAGVEVADVPADFLDRPWVWSRLVPQARALLDRMYRGRPAGRRGEPVVAVGQQVYLDLRGERPLLHRGDPHSGGMPLALRPGAWAEPLDAVLLRLGHLDPGELHPLVHAALVPGTPYRRPPAPDAADVPCSAATHRLALRDGALRALHHTDAELSREDTLAALGGPMSACAAILRSWQSGAGDLPGPVQRLHDELWQRVRYGDLDGVRRLLDAGFPPVPDRGGRPLAQALDDPRLKVDGA